MTSHHCIGNPCWICNPEHAPKSNEKHYEIWAQEIKTREENLYYKDILTEMKNIKDETLEKELLSLLIQDIKIKKEF